MNLDIPGKLRDYYGINVLPMDCLPLEGEDIRDVNGHMYWHAGRRILAAGKLVARRPNLHIIHVTNFKCGPESYIKHFLGEACGKPFLSLQFDGHSNDAGMLTRCEAYLDSKGMLRWWVRPPGRSGWRDAPWRCGPGRAEEPGCHPGLMGRRLYVPRMTDCGTEAMAPPCALWG
jgi:hypothetical protein